MPSSSTSASPYHPQDGSQELIPCSKNVAGTQEKDDASYLFKLKKGLTFHYDPVSLPPTARDER